MSTFLDVKQVVVPSFSHKFIFKCKSHSTQTEHIRTTTLPPQPCKFVLDMCALNRLTYLRSLFFAAGLVNQTKMLNIVRLVMKLFCQLDNCSSTHSYHKILVCHNILFNPEIKKGQFLLWKRVQLDLPLLLWRGLAYITQDK